ncbi:nucleophosmin 1a isoform X2 [Periophthalmus magnuspinnatus]|uniref:nucleophosmin 1a isoform X2 n=1 Tax=Periophthalmus magnuspinnatus TaxID=409849 RepID=UPI00243642A0|nr:nucleophosmin 1a isoform X2 [Periophthalmus magnuspinnatus]
MNGLEEEPMAPQTFLYGCALESGKDYVFNPTDEDFEHQLDLRMACVDPSTKDELQVVEVEGQDVEGQKIKAVLVSLKPSVQPSVCLGGFTMSPPVAFRLKAGSGPVHLSGQHLVMAVDLEEEEDDEDEEEEEEEEIKTLKRPATSPANKSKKMKMQVDDEEEEEEDDDDDEEDDDDDDEDEDEEDEEDQTPVKAKPETKPKAAQNGKSPKPTTPSKKEVKTPKGKGEKSPKTATTPKSPLTLEQVKAKMLETVKKGVTLPKVQVKFDNFVKNSYKVTDEAIYADLWKWRQTVKDPK